MSPRYFDERGIWHDRRQFFGRTIVVVLAPADDKHRHCESIQPVQERICEAFEQMAGCDEVHLLALHELDRQPVWIATLNLVDQCDRIEEEILAPLPVAQPLKSCAAEDSLCRLQPLTDAFDSCPRTERKAAEIIICQREVSDQL